MGKKRQLGKYRPLDGKATDNYGSREERKAMGKIMRIRDRQYLKKLVKEIL